MQPKLASSPVCLRTPVLDAGVFISESNKHDLLPQFLVQTRKTRRTYCRVHVQRHTGRRIWRVRSPMHFRQARILMLSSAIAYGVGHMNGALGLEAWRWLFIIEGVPSGEASPNRFVTSTNGLQWLSASWSSSFSQATPRKRAGSQPRRMDVETRRLGTTGSSKYGEAPSYD